MNNKPGPKPTEARLRFEAKIISANGCWVWTGCISENKWGDKRGRFRITSNKTILAHQAAWVIYKETPINGRLVLHSCDNSLCVKPAHLYLGDHAQNMLDYRTRGKARPRTHCKRGHSLDLYGVWRIRKNSKHKACRLCVNNSLRERRKNAKV